MIHAVIHRSQKNEYTCGPTSLAMLLAFYNVPHNAEELEELCETSEKHGTHHDNLVKAAESLGARAVVSENASIADVTAALQSGHPVLVNYFNPLSNVGHFGIIKGIEDDSVIFADPKNGDNFRLSFAEFEKAWHSHDKTLYGWMMHFL